jgi:hypothetical protein
MSLMMRYALLLTRANFCDDATRSRAAEKRSMSLAKDECMQPSILIIFAAFIWTRLYMQTRNRGANTERENPCARGSAMFSQHVLLSAHEDSYY